MKKLTITNKMNLEEQRTRLIINDTMKYIKNENDMRIWLLQQVTGLVVDGMVLTNAWLSYDAALNYYKEITGQN